MCSINWRDLLMRIWWEIYTVTTSLLLYSSMSFYFELQYGGLEFLSQNGDVFDRVKVIVYTHSLGFYQLTWAQWAVSPHFRRPTISIFAQVFPRWDSQNWQNFLLTLFYYFDRIFLIIFRWPKLLVIDKFLSNIMIIEKFLSNCNSESRNAYLFMIWKVKVSSFSLIEKFLHIKCQFCGIDPYFTRASNHLEMDYAHWQIEHSMSFVWILVSRVALCAGSGTGNTQLWRSTLNIRSFVTKTHLSRFTHFFGQKMCPFCPFRGRGQCDLF